MKKVLELIVRILITLMVIMVLPGCILWPVSEKELIGTYQSVLQGGTPGLPDGGTEVLELRSNGTCQQDIVLKDGRKFSANGTWEYDRGDLTLKGIYSTVDAEEKINPHIEKMPGYISTSAGRSLVGRIILGSTEGTHYEKK